MVDYYSISIDENNMYLIQKLLYYLFYSKNNNIDIKTFYLNGIIDVRGKKKIFAIPTTEFKFIYGNEYILFNYKKDQKSEVDRGNVIRMDIIVLKCQNINTLHEFLYEIEKLEFNVSENKLMKYIWKDSYWKYCNSFKKRNIDTIYLPKNQKNNIISEIECFLNNKNILYEELGLQKKKVFLFWGIPGSGKTTFIKSIASNFNKNIAIVKNTFEIDDNSFENMLDDLPKNSIILFEDIDSLFQGRTNVANTRVTFSGLLNFLDGIMSYDDILIFITTNDIKNIDNALKRRIDIFLEFTYVKKSEMAIMFNNFFKNEYNFDDFFKKIKKPVTVSSLEKYFTRCLIGNLSPINNIELLEYYIDMINIENNQLYQ